MTRLASADSALDFIRASSAPGANLRHMGICEWVLVLIVAYTAIGSDLLLNWGAELITGK